MWLHNINICLAAGLHNWYSAHELYKCLYSTNIKELPCLSLGVTMDRRYDIHHRYKTTFL